MIFHDGGQWTCMIFKYWILHLKEQRVVFSTLVFSYHEQERFDSQTVVFSCGERCALLLRTDFYDDHWSKKKSFKTTQTSSPLTCTGVIWQQNCNWTYSCVFCSKKSCWATKHLFLSYDPPAIPAVCSTLVMCFLCPSLLFTSWSSWSSRHMTWWYSLVPKKKKRIKLNPSATFDVLNQAFMLPLPQAKECSVVWCTRAVECPYSSLVGQ